MIKWTSVKDGLPSEGETALVFSPVDGIGLGIRTSVGFCKSGWVWVHKVVNGGRVIDCVTHYAKINLPVED